MHLFDRAIEPDHPAQTVTEPVPMRLGEVVQLVLAGVHAAGRDLMQQRLPNMGSGALHQRDARPPAASETIAEPSDELEPRSTTADHDDPLQGAVVKTVVLARRSSLLLLGQRLVSPIDDHMMALVDECCVVVVLMHRHTSADSYCKRVVAVLHRPSFRPASTATSSPRADQSSPAHPRATIATSRSWTSSRPASAGRGFGFGQCQQQILYRERRCHSGWAVSSVDNLLAVALVDPGVEQ
jgi:hypothetical protein